MFRNFLTVVFQAAFFRPAFFLSAILFLAPIAAPGEAQTRASARGRVDDYVTFYSMPGFRGDSFTVESAGEISSLTSRRLDFFSGLSSFSSQRRTNWDNAISSIEFNGAFKVTLYTEKNFQGASKSFTVSARTLGTASRISLDNQTSSIAWEPLADGQGQPRAIFYNRDNFQGDSFILYPNDSISKLKTKRRNSRSKNWDDEIRSIRIVGADLTLILYADKEYRGQRVTIRSDANSLSPVGFGAAASSVRVRGNGLNY